MRGFADGFADGYMGHGYLEGRRALVTGGDNGIGRAVAVAFAKEGADVAIAYSTGHDQAALTAELIAAAGRRCVSVPGDLAKPEQCTAAVETTVQGLGGIDLLVNNITYSQPVQGPEDISDEQWEYAFAVNVHSFFRITRAALRYLPKGSAIINTVSVDGLHGNPHLVDHSATEGAVLSLTRALGQSLLPRGIRVNCVAHGPIWTPVGPSAGTVYDQVPIGKPVVPEEIAPSYVFLASNELSSYYTGEVLAAIGGRILQKPVSLLGAISS